MTTLADYVAAVGRKVPDDAGRFSDLSTSLSVTDVRESFVEEAVRQYSRSRPLVNDVVLEGDGASQVHSVPSDWSPGFSVVTGFEYPMNEVPPIIDENKPLQDYILVVRRGGRDWFATPRLTLDLKDLARVHYTTLHTVDAETDTIPPADAEAVGTLAAALACETLATFYAESSESTYGVDHVDHQRKQELFSRLAEAYHLRYTAHLAPGDDGEGEAAVLLGDVDMQSTRGTRAGFIFSNKRSR